MSAPTRGRRNPPDIPPLSRLSWASAARPIQQALRHQTAAFDSLPAPHADTHHFGSSDELIELGDEFLLLAVDPLLPEARVFAPDETTLTHTDGGAGATYLVFVKDAGISNAKLRNSAARSVIGRSAATAGVPADIVAGTDGDVLQRAAGVLTFAPSPVTPSTVTSPAQIVANVNDYALATAQINRLNTDAARDMTGMVAGSSGAERLLVNVGAFNLVVKHQNAGSAAANRFLCQGAADIVLTPDDAADVFYDATTARWRAYLR